MNRTLLAKAAAILLLASGFAGIVDLAWELPRHLRMGGWPHAGSDFLLRIAFLAIGSYLLHAPLEAAGSLRCSSLFLLGYLATGFGLFGSLVIRDSPETYGSLVFDAVTRPSMRWGLYDTPLLWLSFLDAVGALVFTVVPLLLPKPDRRGLLVALLFLALGLSLRPWLYALHFRPS